MNKVLILTMMFLGLLIFNNKILVNSLYETNPKRKTEIKTYDYDKDYPRDYEKDVIYKTKVKNLTRAECEIYNNSPPSLTYDSQSDPQFQYCERVLALPVKEKVVVERDIDVDKEVIYKTEVKNLTREECEIYNNSPPSLSYDSQSDPQFQYCERVLAMPVKEEIVVDDDVDVDIESPTVIEKDLPSTGMGTSLMVAGAVTFFVGTYFVYRKLKKDQRYF